MGQVTVVVSGKGGAGKTSFVAGVSSCLAALGRKVLAIDGDVGMQNLDIALGMTDRTALDFGDVLNGSCTLLQAVATHPDIPKLDLLGAPARRQPWEIDSAAFRAMVSEAREHYDDILIDSAAGVGEGFCFAAEAADRAVVIALPEPASLRGSRRAAELLEEVGISELRLAVNRVRPKLMEAGIAPNIDDAMDTVGIPLLGIIPEDEKVIACLDLAEPLILHAYQGAAKAYLNIARRLLGERVPLERIR